MYEVRDGSRVLRFDGELLAKSTSQSRDSNRWVEFELYRTRGGSYVLGRIGQTRLYHALDCSIVQRNHLKPSEVALLTDQHVPCDECDPDMYLHEIAIERPRFFALKSEMPEAILEQLYMYDESGARYLTRVAQRLVEEACEVDSQLDRAYRVEYIA